MTGKEMGLTGQVIEKFECGHNIKIIKLFPPFEDDGIEYEYAILCACKTRVFNITEYLTKNVESLNFDKSGFTS